VKLKRILASILAMCMVLSSMGTIVFAEKAETDVWDGTIDTSWYNETDNEFTISTAEEWAGLAYLVNGVQSYNPALGNELSADFGYYAGADNSYWGSISATPDDTTVNSSISFEGKTINIDADLDLCPVDANGDLITLPGNEQLSMMPVGYSSFTPFKGTLNGHGHTIKNLFQGGWDLYGLNHNSNVYLGLFGNVFKATIKNLVIDNFTFNTQTLLGGVAGKAGGVSEFDNITVRNSIIHTNGYTYAGGIVGWAYGNMTVKNIDIDESVTLAQTGGNYDVGVGGIIGGCNNVDGESIAFENCYVACKLDVYNDNVANYKTGVYRNCGMVIGALGEGDDESSYEVVIDGNLYPDFVSKGLTFKNVEVVFGDWANYTYCWSDEVDKSCQRIEPGVSYAGIDLSTKEVYRVELYVFDAIFGAENAGNLNNVRGAVNLEVMKFLDEKDYIDAESIVVTEPKILDGEGTEENPYLINNLDDLKKFRDAVNAGVTYAGEYVLLTSDIDLSGEVWTPIGISNYDKTPETSDVRMFAGNFDGGNHTISGLTSEGYIPSADQTKSTEYCFGLFGYVYGSNISNVNMADVDIDCGTRKDTAGNDVAGSGVAALIGYYFPKNDAVSVIENCHVLGGTVKASNNMGGLIGHMDSQISQPSVDITIKNCSNAADVTTEAREAGGILGLMNSAREGNYYVTMRGTVNFVDCVNTGDITSLGGGAPSAGGILGRDHNQAAGQRLKIIFDGCKNSGKITVTANGETHAAGIGAGYYSTGAWLISKNSRNTGDVVVINPSSSVYAGGLISYGGVVELIDSTSTGNVKVGEEAGNRYVGGAQNILFLEGMYDYKDTVSGYTYYLNGGTSPDYYSLVDDAAGGGNFHLVETAHKDNFEFGGWYGDAKYTGDAYTALNKDVKTYYAKWIGTVAKIGDTEYSSLEEAFAAANEGETITLMTNAAPALTSQRKITKAATIDLNGNKMTLTEDDLYFGTTTFKNGDIVVAPSVKPSTAVFWMFKDQTLTFDNVKLTATDVKGTYLIGLDGNNADLNLLNGSEIIVENDTPLDLDIICVNSSTGNDIVIDNSDVKVTNLDGRVFFRGNYTVSGDSEIDLDGITKAGFRIEAGQELNILDTATVNIAGEPRDGGIHIVELPATYFKADGASVNATINMPSGAAKIGNTEYATLQKAVDAAKAGDVVKLTKNVTENITAKAPASTFSLRRATSGVTIDLGKFTLTGNFVVNSDATISIENGAIVNTDSLVSAVQSFGATTLVDVDITSARHGVRVEDGVTTIDGGSYKVGTAGMTTHAVNVSDGGKVVIYDGVFEGPAKTKDSDSGSAVNVQSGSFAEIYGGKFSGGKTSTIAAASDGSVVITEGMFDQDVSAYIAPKSEAIDRGDYDYRYGVAPKAASKIKVTLDETDKENVFDIVINSDGEYDIYEFVSAELVFKNESTTVGGSVMNYEISGYTANGTFAQKAKNAKGLSDNEAQYTISLGAGKDRLSGDGIIIGQVEFFGQGNIKFSITRGEVDTTWQNTNLGRYYVNDGDNATTDDALILGDDASIDTQIAEIHRDVAVNVAFNHNIDTEKYWGDYQITATIKNNAMDFAVTKDITIKDIKSGVCVFEDVPVGYITVTLEAPGFRTYTHNTTLEVTDNNGALVLNFWNDVKRGNNEAIESGKAEMADNFVVGDIVMDMKVDKYDLAAVTSYYGMYKISTSEASKYIRYDLNRDGDIDIRDVQYVLHTMGN